MEIAVSGSSLNEWIIAMRQSEKMIEALMTVLSNDTSEHDARLFRNALMTLAKTARSEVIQEMENDFEFVDKVIRRTRTS